MPRLSRRFLVAGSAVAVVGLWLALPGDVAPVAERVTPVEGLAVAADPAAPARLQVEQTQASTGTAARFNEAGFIRDLQDKFGAQLHIPHAQIRSIEQLLSYLKSQYPDDWQNRVYDFLLAAFPRQADELYARFQNLLQYNDWLLANRAELGRMPVAQRREALWAQRRLAFGPQAQEIWAAEWRSQQWQDALAGLDALEGPQAKLQAYVGSLHAAYGAQTAAVIERRQTELVGHFLNTPAVQADLRQMPPAQRQLAMQNVRRELGMDEAALQRWSDLDQQRDARWATGQTYQVQRAQILQDHSGAAAQQQIAALRQELFGADAAIIADEEAAGFFRYAQDRRFGRE